MLSRKQITFDIDTIIAKKIFGTGYRMLYYYVEKIFEDNNFIHLQGSVYQSLEKISRIQVLGILTTIIDNKPGIEKCIRDIRLTDITDENSLNYLFDYDGTLGRYPDRSGILADREIEYER